MPATGGGGAARQPRGDGGTQKEQAPPSFAGFRERQQFLFLVAAIAVIALAAAGIAAAVRTSR